MESIVQAVLEKSIDNPDKIAIATGIKKITYRELSELIISFATCLKEKGIKKGSRIIIEAVELTSFFAAYLGCQLAGVIAIPIERNISIYQLQNVMELTKPALVFFKSNGEKYNDYFGVIPENKIRYPKGNVVSTIASTTGTTGDSVLVTHTNKSMLATVQNLVNGINITEKTVLFTNVPFDLSAGYRRVLATLFVGATAVITYKPLKDELLLDFFKEYNINSVTLLNIDLNYIFSIKNEELLSRFSFLDFVETVAGSITSCDIHAFRAKFPNVTLYNVYGTTESGCLLINNTTDNPMENCLGKPSCNTEIKIIDENGKQVTTAGKYGYIAVKGDMNMQGYYRKKTLSESVMIDEHIIISDIIYFDENGYYYFVSRVGDIIDVSGRKVIPAEIENVAIEYDTIIDCACSSEEDNALGQIPVLYVVCKDKDYNIDKIKEYLKNNLEDYKVPKKIFRVKKIPRTSNGKILRRSLPTAQRIN
ncbi:MAG: acyl--CoA ligase [Clostridia bacterium]|nr:acyl--CoA ligase [Clostridia bacterium]